MNSAKAIIAHKISEILVEKEVLIFLGFDLYLSF